MSAATQAPDTPRRHIDALARRAADCPHLSDGIEDEVALVSAITDRAAMERAFGALVLAHRRREREVAESVLDLLTGRLR